MSGQAFTRVIDEDYLLFKKKFVGAFPFHKLDLYFFAFKIIHEHEHAQKHTHTHDSVRASIPIYT